MIEQMVADYGVEILFASGVILIGLSFLGGKTGGKK